MDINFVKAFTDKFNLYVGSCIAILSYIFGKDWWLFAAFLLFNIIDWITGWMKSRIAGVENSTKGFKGVLKKFGYWLMILVSFVMSYTFIKIGNVLGVNLQITSLLGWFVLASLMINELRSILENFVEAGYNPPAILIKGLSVARKIIESNEDDPEQD